MTNTKSVDLKETRLDTIVDGLEYLQVEASREGFNDVSDMVLKIINEIRELDHQCSNSEEALYTQGSSGEVNLPKIIELLKSFSSLDKAQIDGLKKLINIVQ